MRNFAVPLLSTAASMIMAAAPCPRLPTGNRIATFDGSRRVFREHMLPFFILCRKNFFGHNSFFNSNKYGFEGLISAPSALKIFEIHKVFLQIFALTGRKSSPTKLLRIWNAIDYVQSGISSLQAYFRMSKRKMPECAWDIVFQTYSIAVKKTKVRNKIWKNSLQQIFFML